MTDTIKTWQDRMAQAGYAEAFLHPRSFMQEEIDELRSALAQQAEQGWKPISTAPKDGAEVLLGEPDGSITVAYWNEPKVEFTTDGGYDAPWATHWMPLPSAPKGVV